VTMAQLGLLFPGQGAQRVGMGAGLYAKSAAAKAVFDLAESALGIELKRLCFEGPQEELNRTDISQPAMLVASLATFEALREAGKLDLARCRAAAGLSLGEYAALAAANALSYADAVRIVYERGRLMQQACDANPGAMVSVIGLPASALEEICKAASTEGEIAPANYNSPEQTVISGVTKAVEKAGAAAKERGARVVPLQVAGGFHSKLMTSAAENLAPLLRQLKIGRPAIPVVANVTGAEVTDPEVIRDCLIRQVNHPVRWLDCMRTLLDSGTTEFLEVGPGRVLAGLMRKIASSAKVTSLSTPEDIEQLQP